MSKTLDDEFRSGVFYSILTEKLPKDEGGKEV
jgi:hypothetical protein